VHACTVHIACIANVQPVLALLIACQPLTGSIGHCGAHTLKYVPQEAWQPAPLKHIAFEASDADLTLHRTAGCSLYRRHRVTCMPHVVQPNSVQLQPAAAAFNACNITHTHVLCLSQPCVRPQHIPFTPRGATHACCCTLPLENVSSQQLPSRSPTNQPRQNPCSITATNVSAHLKANCPMRHPPHVEKQNTYRRPSTPAWKEAYSDSQS
jgi:hypothetical protein